MLNTKQMIILNPLASGMQRHMKKKIEERLFNTLNIKTFNQIFLITLLCLKDMFICILRFWLGLLNAFMPVAPKPPDYSANISLKKAIFQNILDKKCQSKSKATTHFQILCILLTYLKIISISIKGPHNTCHGDLQA